MHNMGLSSDTVWDVERHAVETDVDLFRVEKLAWSRLDDVDAEVLRTHFQYGLPIHDYVPLPVALYSGNGRDNPVRWSGGFTLATELNAEGWSSLSVSVSGSLRDMTGLAEVYGEHLDAVTVLDLQQESHAIVDGEPVSWAVPFSWSNIGATAEEVTEDEARRIAALRTEVAITLTPRPSKKPSKAARLVLHPHICAESEMVENVGARYVRIAATDWLAPSAALVDCFIALEQSLPSVPRLHIHCRQGKGRTGVFLAMHDMLRNAQIVPFVDLIARLRAFHPHNVFCELADFEKSNHEIYSCERVQFIRLFYEYACTNPMGRPQRWSEWLIEPRVVWH